jgi:hypothetical protein
MAEQFGQDGRRVRRRLPQTFGGRVAQIIWIMTDDEKRVLSEIHSAFAGVVLGDGIGLREADGLDAYADAQTLSVLRSQDEKHDWTLISFDDLDRYCSALTFFDSEGMRFHLPAYLAADLAGALFTVEILTYLVGFAYGLETQFQMLSTVQRRSVSEFLLLRLADPSFTQFHPGIETAFCDYWASN